MPPQQTEDQSSKALDFALTVHPIQNNGPTTNDESRRQNEVLPAPETQQNNIPLYKRAWGRWCAFYRTNSFLILVICATLLAYAYPPLGAIYLAPQITATWIAVMFIFSECSQHIASTSSLLNFSFI